MRYPIKPKCVAFVDQSEDKLTSLDEANYFLSNSITENQFEYCRKLGLTFSEDEISLNFTETGKVYTNTERTTASDVEISEKIQIRFRNQDYLDRFPLILAISNSVQHQNYVNFFGEIKFNAINNDKNEIFVPLVGKGTVSLEGRPNDALSGLCFNRDNAAFQQKIALISSILSAIGISRDEIEIFRAHVLKLCGKFYGIDDIINYTIDKSFGITTETFYNYMVFKYQEVDEEEVPVMLQHFIDFFEPHPSYYDELQEIFTPEELSQEIENMANPEISRKVREIINKFIFFNDIYLPKPYPGEKLLCFNNKSISIYDVAAEINSGSSSRILKCLANLGFVVSNDKITIKFLEKGQKLIKEKSPNNYSITKRDEAESEIEFEIDLRRKFVEMKEVKLFLDTAPIKNVNFFGQIEMNKTVFSSVIVPLVGRGTLALEGTINNPIIGFCYSGPFASFQQKVAIFYSFLIAFDIDTNELKRFEQAVMKVNSEFYDRDEILQYTFKVSKQEEHLSYFEYMRRSNLKYSTMPIALKVMLTYNKLPSRYYEEMLVHYNEQELIQEEKLFEISRVRSFVPRMFNRLVHSLKSFDLF